MANVDSSNKNGCWIWVGGKDKHGYGMAWNGVRWEKAHRVSFRIHKGEIPGKLYVCHSCDNPSCVNPNHLWLGTAKDNMHDAINKGRFKFLPHAEGTQVHNAKLTDEAVRDIRSRYRFRKVTASMLASEYGVSIATILYAAHRRTYKNA